MWRISKPSGELEKAGEFMKTPKTKDNGLQQLLKDVEAAATLRIELDAANATVKRLQAELAKLKEQKLSLKDHLAEYRRNVLRALETEEPYPAEVPAHVRHEIEDNLRRDAFTFHTESLRIMDVVLTRRLILRVKAVPQFTGGMS